MMFEAIRSKLVGAWKDLHARGLPSLFVFELIVVTLGVLLAQSIAEWSDERAAIKRMRAAEIQWFETAGANAYAFESWHRGLPCLRERLADYRVTLTTGALTRAQTQRPGIIAPFAPRIHEEAALLLGEVKGHNLIDRMRTYAAAGESLEEAVWRFANGWGRLSVAASGAGAVSDGDRQEARIVLSELEAQLGSIQRITEFAIPYGAALGVEVRGDGVRLIEGCADLWSYNTLAPPADSAVVATGGR